MSTKSDKFAAAFIRRTSGGLTLVELMVVILIVGILAAVAIPSMRGRIDSAKWTEGKTMMGTIATATRAYIAEKSTSAAATALVGDFSAWGSKLGFAASDFQGNYFTKDDLSITACSYPDDSRILTFTVTATAPVGISYPGTVILDQAGTFTETP